MQTANHPVDLLTEASDLLALAHDATTGADSWTGEMLRGVPVPAPAGKRARGRSAGSRDARSRGGPRGIRGEGSAEGGMKQTLPAGHSEPTDNGNDAEM
jgi:hypothetical protein